MIDELKSLFKSNRKYSLNEICHNLKNYEKDDIVNGLNQLEIEGFLFFNDVNYQIFPNNFKLVNIMIDRNNCGYFYIKDKRYNINNLNGALNKDLCVINMDNLNVQKIVKRKTQLLIAKFENNNFEIINNNIDYKINVKNNDIKKMVDGNIVLLRINSADNNELKCDLVEILGHINDPDIILKAIAISKSFDIEFSNSYIKKLEKIDNCVTEKDLVDRLDLRNDLIYTIDCDETKDMDDAISVSINEKGNYVVGVHIADVSHYVKPGDIIFEEAYKRSTSVYMVDTVIPMIHHYLSNGICSLNPNVDRLTISCIVELDKTGNILDYEIKKSVINSKKKMKYSDVNEILMNGNIPNGYEQFVDNLNLANEVSKLINKVNKNNGYLQFGNREIKYTNETFSLTKPQAAEKIIEMFMLLANKVVAENFKYLPFPFRIHENPSQEELADAFEKLKNMGYDIPNIQNYENSHMIQNVLKSLYEAGNFSITSYLVLRSMKKARYSPENVGHFGLGFDCYTHFTSPIRRFNDLLVHTIVSNYITSDYTNIDALNDNLAEICDHISEKEVLADEAEEEALNYKMAEFMEHHIGEYFNGKIISLNANYATIKLENNIIGIGYLKDMKEVYHFDGNEYCLKNYKNDELITMGDYVRIKNIYACKNARKINFKITEKLDHVKIKTLI